MSREYDDEDSGRPAVSSKRARRESPSHSVPRKHQAEVAPLKADVSARTAGFPRVALADLNLNPDVPRIPSPKTIETPEAALRRAIDAAKEELKAAEAEEKRCLAEVTRLRWAPMEQFMTAAEAYDDAEQRLSQAIAALKAAWDARRQPQGRAFACGASSATHSPSGVLVRSPRRSGAESPLAAAAPVPSQGPNTHPGSVGSQ